MKRIILYIAFITLGLTTYAQEEEEVERSGDTTKIKIGDSQIFFIGSCSQDEDSVETKDDDDGTMMVDFGMGGYSAPGLELTLPDDQSLMELSYEKSRSFGFTVVHKGANLIKDRLYVTSGLGFNLNSYQFKNNINVSTDNDSTRFMLDTLVDYDRYKLKAAYLQVPLILGTRIGNLERPLGLQIGVVGSFKVRSVLKQKYESNGTVYKTRVKDDFNLNPFKLEAVGRVTIGDIGIFARYGLTDLFQKNKAPSMTPFAIGVTIGDWSIKEKKKPKDS